MNNTTMARRFTVLGTTDEVNVCDCCGKKDLKATIALEDEDGSILHYGCVCAARAMKIEATEVRSAARAADTEKAHREAAAREAASRAHDAAWQAFLDAKVPIKDWSGRGDRMAQIAALGGMQAARALFQAVAT